MADYVTQSDLELLMGPASVIQLTDDAGVGTVDTDVLDAIIANGEGEINAYLYKGYVGPITVAEHGQLAYNTVKQIALRVIRYQLYMRRVESVPEQLIEDYSRALEQIEKMAKGSLSVPGDPPVPRTSAEASVGSAQTLTAYDVDDQPINRSWTKKQTGLL
jgi:phage gp36-like protein